jgi:hypothetical protein
MKLTKFSQMKKRDDSMMLFVSDDLLDDSDEDSEVLILEILEDLADFEIEGVWISIWEICLDDSSDEDSEEVELKYVNEKISKKL